MKLVAQHTSDAGQRRAISSHVPATQGKHIFWVGIRASEFGLLGEKVHYSPHVTSRKWELCKGKPEDEKKIRAIRSMKICRKPHLNA